MNLVLVGSSGMIGQRILDEALQRDHRVTAVMRDPAKLKNKHANLLIERGDVMKPGNMLSIAAGHDAVISAFGPGGRDARLIVDAARALVRAMETLPATRLLVIGGAGSLEVAPGRQLVDTPDFPAAWKPPALAHREALGIYRMSDINWTCLSPPAMVEPGDRTGCYRIGNDQLVTDAHGQSRISAEDLACAALDELERPKFLRQRFTVAY